MLLGVASVCGLIFPIHLCRAWAQIVLNIGKISFERLNKCNSLMRRNGVIFCAQHTWFSLNANTLICWAIRLVCMAILFIAIKKKLPSKSFVCCTAVIKLTYTIYLMRPYSTVAVSIPIFLSVQYMDRFSFLSSWMRSGQDHRKDQCLKWRTYSVHCTHRTYSLVL